jgi:pyruvate/2-oxoglutarate dehydrogenase complex dihydrolipoamide acyltransferase (E2) component
VSKISSETKRKITRSLPGIALILVAATLLTYGSAHAVTELTKPKTVAKKTVVVVKEEPKTEEQPAADASTPATSSSSTAAAATATTTPAQPTTPTATTNSFVYLRPTASTAGIALKDLQAGTVVQYEIKSTGLWQKVTVDGVTGYVYKKWLTY